MFPFRFLSDKNFLHLWCYNMMFGNLCILWSGWIKLINMSITSYCVQWEYLKSTLSKLLGLWYFWLLLSSYFIDHISVWACLTFSNHWRKIMHLWHLFILLWQEYYKSGGYSWVHGFGVLNVRVFCDPFDHVGKVVCDTFCHYRVTIWN